MHLSLWEQIPSWTSTAMPIIIYIQYHKTTHIHFEDQPSSELSPVLSKWACLRIEHSMIHRHSNKENCHLGGLTSSTKVPRRNLSTLNNGLRARTSQEDKHYCNTAKCIESGKQTGFLTQLPQCRAVTVLLPTRHGRSACLGHSSTVSLLNPAQNDPSRKGGLLVFCRWMN